MAIELVNGYVCRNCAAAALAQRGIDPAHPDDKPGEPRKAHPADPLQAAGGSTSNPNPVAQPDGVNQPVAAGDRGTVVNLVT
jgi:hypothetical protein